MPEAITYPARVATIIRATNEVSTVAELCEPPKLLKDRPADAYEFVAVDDDVRVGMFRQKDGSFRWPIGHQNEPYVDRKAREARADDEKSPEAMPGHVQRHQRGRWHVTRPDGTTFTRPRKVRGVPVTAV